CGGSDAGTRKAEARRQAVAGATANAKLYAEAAGGTLGKVLSIAEDEGMVVTRYASPAPMDMAAKAVPIEAGTATVGGRGRMSFELGGSARPRALRPHILIQIKAEPLARRVVLSG